MEKVSNNAPEGPSQRPRNQRRRPGPAISQAHDCEVSGCIEASQGIDVGPPADRGPRPPGQPRRRDYVDPRIWQREDMREALAHRDISAMYRILQRFGVSQRAIACKTGQAQSEISEIIAGRQVICYGVLVRIAEGFDVPRGWLGLAYDRATAEIMDTPASV